MFMHLAFNSINYRLNNILKPGGVLMRHLHDKIFQPKHVAHFGQQKSQNTVVIDGPPLYLYIHTSQQGVPPEVYL
jgi:hypothetical protein